MLTASAAECLSCGKTYSRMKRQRIYLESYDWDISVYYDSVADDAPGIMRDLSDAGCDEENLRRSHRSLTDGGFNSGLTYSNARDRRSIMVIGRTSSLAQFLDTFSHELTHLCQHICQEYGINPWSEEIAYLAGELARRMHPVLSRFMCGCGVNYER